MAEETSFPTHRAARLAHLSPSQIRSFVRDGWVTPRKGRRGRLEFSFSDVVRLRTAGQLTRALSARAVHRALRRLAGGASVHVEGRRIVVVDPDGAYDADTGQARLSLVPPAPAVSLPTKKPEPDAAQIYLDALAADPEHAAAHLDLGRLMHQRGRLLEAADHYHAALRFGADPSIAAYNLGVLFEDLGEPDNAVSAYLRVLELEPRCAEAHRHLARIYETKGDQLSAIRHLSEFRRLTRA